VNYNVFDIPQHLTAMSRNPAINLYGPERDKVISDEIQRVYKAWIENKKIFSTVENRGVAKFDKELMTMSFLIKYLSELNKMIEILTPRMIGPTEDFIDPYGIPVFMGFQKLTNSRFEIVRNVLSYYMDIYKEIYFLIKNDCLPGALARMRVLIETYCIFIFFSKHPGCIDKFVDHSFITEFLQKKNENPASITQPEEDRYEVIRQKFKTDDDFKRFCTHYGWAGDDIKNTATNTEIIKFAVHGDEKAYKDLHNFYNYLSEFSHTSAFAVISDKAIDINVVKYNLDILGDMFLSLTYTYIDWFSQYAWFRSRELEIENTVLRDLRIGLFHSTKKH
jgi:hypothetical protein